MTERQNPKRSRSRSRKSGSTPGDNPAAEPSTTRTVGQDSTPASPNEQTTTVTTADNKPADAKPNPPVSPAPVAPPADKPAPPAAATPTKPATVDIEKHPADKKPAVPEPGGEPVDSTAGTRAATGDAPSAPPPPPLPRTQAPGSDAQTPGGGPRPPQRPPVPPEQGTGGSGKGLAVGALVLALAALGLSGYQWVQSSSTAQTQAAALATVREQAAKAAGVAESVAALPERMTTVGDKADQLAAQVSQLQSELQTLRQTVDSGQGSSALAEQELARIRGEVERLQAEVQSSAEARESALGEFDQRLTDLRLGQQGLMNRFDAVELAVSSGGDTHALPLSEVLYLLRMAQHKLHLQKDVAGARQALQLAQERLGVLNEPGFEAVGIMIRENLATLDGVSMPDYSRLAEGIHGMTGKIAELPMRDLAGLASLKASVQPDLAALETDDTSSVDGWWQSFKGSLAAAFGDIIVIRHERAEAPPLMALEEQYFLRENLRLKLEAMRVALLTRDAVNFQASNAQAREWVHTYFDPADATVAQMLVDLQNLQTLEFTPYLPDLSGTVRAFADATEARSPMRTVNPEAAAHDADGGAQ